MVSNNSHVKLTCGRVISSIIILSILLSSWILLSEKAIKLVRFIQYSSQNSEESIDTLMNNGDEESEGLKLRISEANIKLMESQFEDFLELRGQIQTFHRNYREEFDTKVTLEDFLKLFFFAYIDEASNLYKQYIENLKMKISNDALCIFAQSVTSDNEDGLGDILRSIEKHVLPVSESKPYGNLFGTMRNYFMDDESRNCGRNSIQQRIYKFFELLIRNEKIAFSVHKLSYSILTQCYQENYTDEEESALEEIIRRIREYTAFISTVMTDLPCDARRCTPWFLERNENFFALERVDIPIPINEGEVISSNECTGTCSNIARKAISIETMYTDDIINMTACDTCESIKSSHLCRKFHPHANDVMRFIDTRQYLIIHNFCHRILYQRKNLPKKNDCDDCVCRCTNPDVDIRSRYAFSLRPQESNVSDNMIVTGIRFHKTNNSNGVKVIYPQIKVAKLSSEGLSEAVWKDVGNFDNGPWPSGEAGVDYAIIGRGGNQSMIINLDHNRGKPGYVVTGVKFQLRYDQYREKKYEGDEKKSFEIAVRLTPCNLTTGHLSASESIYTDPDAEMASAVNNDVESKVPTRTRILSNHRYTSTDGNNWRPSPEFHQYIEISQSRRDLYYGQITIPLFNLQSVDPTPAFPLSEINLFYDNHSFPEFLEFKVTVSLIDILRFERYKNLSAIEKFISTSIE